VVFSQCCGHSHPESTKHKHPEKRRHLWSVKKLLLKGENPRKDLATSNKWVSEGEYGANAVCTCTKMEKQDMLKLFQECGEGGMNSTMIHCKNFCKYHSVPPVQQ
jgi:hypothetical protein